MKRYEMWVYVVLFDIGGGYTDIKAIFDTEKDAREYIKESVHTGNKESWKFKIEPHQVIGHECE